MEIFRGVGLIKFIWPLICLFFLTSCFSSEAPLLGAGDTPFPGAFHTVALDDNGHLALDAHAHADISSVEQVGLSYKFTDAKMAKMVTFRMWDSATRTYAAQIVSLEPNAPQGMKILYGLAVANGDVLTLYLPGKDPSLQSAVEALGVEQKSGLYLFSNRDQLFDALGAFSHRLDKAMILRSRIYSGPSEAKLQSDIAEAQAAAASGRTTSASSSEAKPETSTAAPSAPLDLRQVNPVTDPKQLASDPGSDAPNSCDEQAAHPKDPNRMAAGVPMEKMVPRLAQQECERAVAHYPNTARFRYQLGRAFYAARNWARARQSTPGR